MKKKINYYLRISSKEIIEESLPPDVVENYQILVGTPEEFQGHERDVMIFSMCLDKTCIRGSTHYQNENRWNVATSRAKYFTIAVYSEIPSNYTKITSYFNSFGHSPEVVIPSNIPITKSSDHIHWEFDPTKYESEFENHVYLVLVEYIKKNQSLAKIQIFNQVQSCGQKRLDFVLYNHETKKSVAIEVDGPHHFLTNGYYSEEHISRIEILKRAGWEIINTPYYCWYENGWLSSQTSEKFSKEVKRIYRDLDVELGIAL